MLPTRIPAADLESLGDVVISSVADSEVLTYDSATGKWVNATGHDVKLFGATSGAFAMWDESEDSWLIRGPAATPGMLVLQTAETTVVDGDKLGQIDFQAPLEASGTDAIVVGASIWAEADDTFAADNNSTELVFATANSGAVSEAVRIDHDGNVGIGTTTPAYKLHIMSPSGTPNNAWFTTNDWVSATTGSGLRLYFGASAGDTCTVLSATDQGGNSAAILSLNPGAGNVGIGTLNPNQKLTIEGTMDLKEQAAANADTAAYGQIWVKTATPNELYFTDDAGTDTQISPHPLDAPPELFAHGPGIDMIDKRVQKYLGAIYWTNLMGNHIEESFEDYNARRRGVPGHVDLVKLDWSEHVAKTRAEWKKAWIAENTHDKEVPLAEAVEEIEVEEEDRTVKPIGTEIERTGRYKLVGSQVIEEERRKRVYPTRTVRKKQLKAGLRFEEETGQIFRTVVPTDTEAEAEASREFACDLPAWITERMPGAS